MEHWDPIGVRGMARASDEYDTYVGEVYVLLMDQRTSAVAIASYLFGIATEYMGISATEELERACSTTAEILVALRPEFETH